MQKTNKKQRQLLHMLAGKLGYDRETYEAILLTKYKKASSTELYFYEANELIKEWQEKAIKAGVWDKGWYRQKQPQAEQKERFNNLKNRSEFATPPQLRMLEALWMDKANVKTEKAFHSFIKRIVKVDHPRFLLREHVQKLKKAIENLR